MSRVPTLPEHGPLKTRVEDLLAVLARPHMLGIMYAIGLVLKPPVRFNQIMELVQVSPTTLTARLKEAVEVGFLTRTTFDEIPPRVEYAPTPAFMELEPAFKALNQWCKIHELGA